MLQDCTTQPCKNIVIHHYLNRTYWNNLASQGRNQVILQGMFVQKSYIYNYSYTARNVQVAASLDVRMRSHRLLRFDDNKSAAICQLA